MLLPEKTFLSVETLQIVYAFCMRIITSNNCTQAHVNNFIDLKPSMTDFLPRPIQRLLAARATL